MNQSRAEEGLLKKFPKRPTEGNMRRAYNRNPKKMICGTIGAVALFGSGAAAYSLSRIFSEGSNVSSFNSTNFTTISPYQFESPTIGLFNETGWNNNSFTGSELAYSAYVPSSTTVPNENIYDSSITELLPTNNPIETLNPDSNGLNVYENYSGPKKPDKKL